jgi:hypothetical protein
MAMLFSAAMAEAQAPLSAIDWLNKAPSVTLTPAHPPVVEGAVVPEIAVTALDTVRPDAVGLLPGSVTGLPATLWSNSTTQDLTRYIERLAERPLPALQALYYTLLLAEANPPPDTGREARFLNARLAALRRFGAVEPALALVERAGGASPALFEAWLDLALLEGGEAPACAALAEAPHLSRDIAARVYCVSRGRGNRRPVRGRRDPSGALSRAPTHRGDRAARASEPDDAAAVSVVRGNRRSAGYA